MKLAAAAAAACIFLSIGFRVESAKRETAKQLQEFIRLLLFAGQEIETRGSILEEVFSKAAFIVEGKTKCLVLRISQGLAKGHDFKDEWDAAVREIYSGIGWNAQEQECILHCAADFLLPERKMVREQLSFDAKQLSGLFDDRAGRLKDECKLCRVLSFCAAAFLLILML